MPVNYIADIRLQLCNHAIFLLLILTTYGCYIANWDFTYCYLWTLGIILWIHVSFHVFELEFRSHLQQVKHNIDTQLLSLDFSIEMNVLPCFLKIALIQIISTLSIVSTALILMYLIWKIEQFNFIELLNIQVRIPLLLIFYGLTRYPFLLLTKILQNGSVSVANFITTSLVLYFEWIIIQSHLNFPERFLIFVIVTLRYYLFYDRCDILYRLANHRSIQIHTMMRLSLVSFPPLSSLPILIHSKYFGSEVSESYFSFLTDHII